MKRGMDVALGGLFAVLSVPVIVVCALWLALKLRSFPFFVQHRIGWQGRRFRVVKLRTLPPTTPRYVDKYELTALELSPLAARLRRWHLDELPQLFLVPLGRMSLVGPRPEMPALHEALPAAVAARRTAVRPGCTGLWQISHDSGGLIGESPEYDEFYLAHRSVALDLWILGQTATLMVGRGRRSGLIDIPERLRRRVGADDRASAGDGEAWARSA